MIEILALRTRTLTTYVDLFMNGDVLEILNIKHVKSNVERVQKLTLESVQSLRTNVNTYEHTRKELRQGDISIVSVPVFERWCLSLRHNQVRIRAFDFRLIFLHGMSERHE